MAIIVQSIIPSQDMTTVTLTAKDDVTNEEQVNTKPFPIIFDALMDISSALAITPEETDQTPQQLLWVAAGALDNYEGSVINNVDGEVVVQVDGNTVARIDVTDGQVYDLV